MERLGGPGKDPMRLAFPRAVPLLAVIAVFFGLATVAHAQPGNVAVFDNSDYVDNTSMDFSAELAEHHRIAAVVRRERHPIH